MSSFIFFFFAAVVLGLLFLLALKRVRNGSFYGDTPWLSPLGVYVWGDGLILLPFWSLISLLFVWSGVGGTAIIRLYLVFTMVRSGYEVVYWLLHQSAKDTYRPPLIRKFDSLAPRDGAILYQLAHTCFVVVSIWILVLL
ncbi:MAG: hypothetical protein GW946_01385 [Candidatus Pacebacteria bacterium]|nr:hypothetical protein [Candidatus Paceibacterota bacterium]PIR60762.1 MAG: hypothetical protein COU67_00555 [Candidatus Pacebacteria bacterium CG10_big_fil_rev_8_21_14_0_10_44_54]